MCGVRRVWFETEPYDEHPHQIFTSSNTTKQIQTIINNLKPRNGAATET